MKRILLFSILLLSIIGCTKDDANDFDLSQEFLTGKWKMVSFQNKSTTSGDLISDFDLSTFPESYIMVNDTGLAVFNAPSKTLDTPQQNNETYTDEFKIINGEFYLLKRTLVSSGIIDPTTGEYVYVFKDILVKEDNAFNSDGLLFIRNFDSTNENGSPNTDIVNIRVFKKTGF